MNGMRECGDLSTRKVIDLLRHGLERCIVCLVNQSDSVPERAGEFKHQITLTKLDGEVARRGISNNLRQDKRSYSALASNS